MATTPTPTSQSTGSEKPTNLTTLDGWLGLIVSASGEAIGHLFAGIFVGIALCAWLGAEFSTTLKDHPKIPQVAIGLAAVALFFTIRFAAKVIRKARGITHAYSVALDELEPFKKLAAAGQLDKALKDDDVAIRNLTFEIFSKIPNRVQVSLDIENLTKGQLPRSWNLLGRRNSNASRPTYRRNLSPGNRSSFVNLSASARQRQEVLSSSKRNLASRPKCGAKWRPNHSGSQRPGQERTCNARALPEIASKLGLRRT